MCRNCAGGCGGDFVRSIPKPRFEILDGARTVAAAASASPLIVEEKPICGFAMASLVAEIGGLGPSVFAGSLTEAMDVAGRLDTPLALVDLFTIGFDFEGLRSLASATEAALVAIDDRPIPLSPASPIRPAPAATSARASSSTGSEPSSAPS